jgi:hypothetical protein
MIIMMINLKLEWASVHFPHLQQHAAASGSLRRASLSGGPDSDSGGDARVTA